MTSKIIHGDWQTPQVLSDQVCSLIVGDFKSILEPTCGDGNFLLSATKFFPGAKKYGFDISEEHIENAKQTLRSKAIVNVGDFFEIDWKEILSQLEGPILIIGNPPWVTNTVQGKLSTTNLPQKESQLKGLSNLTGKSNFDISKWMILHLLNIVKEREITLAFLVKSIVAKQVIEHIASHELSFSGEIRTIDAKKHFSVSVDAVLLHLWTDKTPNPKWGVYSSLCSQYPKKHIGVVEGRLYSDLESFDSTKSLEGTSKYIWRSGIKHDCSKVMEISKIDRTYTNKLDQTFDLESEYVYPLLKGSDIANGRLESRLHVIVPQKKLGQDTREIETKAPLLWDYLSKNKNFLDNRKSRVYEGKPPFSIFGIGDYSFSPYKIAICGLYKRFSFTLLEPHEEKPIMVDDTCYFLSFETKKEAQDVYSRLNSKKVQEFFEARVFWKEKRPITKSLLETLCIENL